MKSSDYLLVNGHKFFPYADFSNADLAGITISGHDAPRGGARVVNLSGINFENANLSGAVFENCVLSEAKLQHANLHGAKLKNVQLEGAFFSYANLREVEFTKVLFNSARFVEVDLQHATLVNCDLGNTDLHDSNLQGLTFSNCYSLRLKLNGVILPDGKRVSRLFPKGNELVRFGCRIGFSGFDLGPDWGM